MSKKIEEEVRMKGNKNYERFFQEDKKMGGMSMKKLIQTLSVLLSVLFMLGSVTAEEMPSVNLKYNPQYRPERKYKCIPQYKDWKEANWPVPFEDPNSKLPFWVRNWNYWAKKTGNKEWIAWGRRLAKPEAIKLGLEWIKFNGIDCSKIVALSKIAPEIRPGVVITQQNWKKYEKGLKELWPKSLWLRLINNCYIPIRKVTVCPTQHIYKSKGVLYWTKKYLGKAHIDKEGMMDLSFDNYVAGVPFPFVPTCAKWDDPKMSLGDRYGDKYAWWIVHNMDRLVVGQDHLSFNPITLPMHDRHGKLERTQKWGLYWRIYWGRMDLEPMPYVPGQEDIESKGSVVATYPFDVRGFAATRWRYCDKNKEALFMCYLPALRRIRRLSGSDTQDPILGTDLTWEDWKAWWQKISQTIWPSKAVTLRAEEILIPVIWDRRFQYDEKNFITTYWERRPSWVIDYIAVPPSTYFYKVRRAWIDFEIKRVNYGEYYDKRGRLWRTWIDCKRWQPETGYFTWWGCDIIDHVNRHWTPLLMQGIPNDPKVTDNYFNLRFLSRMAH